MNTGSTSKTKWFTQNKKQTKYFMKKIKISFKAPVYFHTNKAGDLAQQFRALPVVTEDLGSSSQHPHASSQPPITSVLRIQTSSSDLQVNQAHTQCTYIHTYMQTKHSYT